MENTKESTEKSAQEEHPTIQHRSSGASKDTFDKKEIEEGKGMAILAYIIPLIPFFAEKKNKYVVYHAKNGMNLLIICLIWGILAAILSAVIKVDGCAGWGSLLGSAGVEACKVTPGWLLAILSLISAGLGVFAIIGIVNAAQGKAKELPLIGAIKIFK